MLIHNDKEKSLISLAQTALKIMPWTNTLRLGPFLVEHLRQATLKESSFVLTLKYKPYLKKDILILLTLKYLSSCKKLVIE